MATGASNQYREIVHCGGQSIEFLVDLGRRRNLYISVYPDSSIVVKAPRGTNKEDILEFVLSRSDWILTHTARFESLSPVSLDRPYVDGAIHLFKGDGIPLAVMPGLFDSVEISNGNLVVNCQGWHSEELVGELVEEWFLDQAMDFLPRKLAEC